MLSETFQIKKSNGKPAYCPYCHRGRDFYLDSDECPVCGNTLPAWMTGILHKENKKRRRENRRAGERQTAEAAS